MPTVNCTNCSEPRGVTQRTLEAIHHGERSGLCRRCAQSAPGRKVEKAECIHCHQNRTIRARGLCCYCSSFKSIRKLYPVKDSPVNRRGVGGGMKTKAPLPKWPTMARPGSPEKVAVMMARAKAGAQLFHPHDAKAVLA